jgi:hypothetical protein
VHREELKFGRLKEKGGGTTNAEKKRHQPFLLAKRSRAVREKMVRSLRAMAGGACAETCVPECG